MILRVSAHRNAARHCLLHQDMYIGESCGVGYQAQVLRIASILYNVGALPCCCFCFCFDMQRVSRKGLGIGGSSIRLQELGKTM